MRQLYPPMRARPAALSVAGMALMIAGLAACSDPSIKTRSVTFSVATNTNADNALAVDLVLVVEPTLVPAIAEMNAATWFKSKAGLTLANPTGLEVRSFELVPGQPGPRWTVDGPGEDAVAALLFARYAAPGLHRARVDAMRHVLVRLGETTFSVTTPPS